MLKDDFQPGFENLFLLLLPLSGIPYVPYHKTEVFHLLSSANHLFWVVWSLCTVIDHYFELSRKCNHYYLLSGGVDHNDMTTTMTETNDKWQWIWKLTWRSRGWLYSLTSLPLPVGGGEALSGGGWLVIEGVVCRIFETAEGHEKGKGEEHKLAKVQWEEWINEDLSHECLTATIIVKLVIIRDFLTI